MSLSAPPRVVTVALLGNPNTGKSTLFSALCGVRQRVANYPGVTVEKKIGRTEIGGHTLDVIDLPGTYSLAPKSPDEMVAVDVLLGRRSDVPRPDVVLVIVDASNLERNFYLLSQVLELGLPTVVALNMIDVAATKGQTLDIPALRKRLHIPLVEVQANRKIGLTELKAAIGSAVGGETAAIESPFPEKFQNEVATLERLAGETDDSVLPRYLAERLLLDTSGYLSEASIAGITPEILKEVTAARGRLKSAGIPIPAVEAMARYQWAGSILKGIINRPAQRPITFSDKLDKLLTNRVFGTIFFLVLMLFMFQAVFWINDVLMIGDGIDYAAGWMQSLVNSALPEGALRSLINDGVIAGVGGVVVFLPQILTLFCFIAILEDCGYMARAAYLMDKLMSKIGLSGKSFIPLLSSFACAVPGIMATRVIENRRDRLVTILVAPLMSCSARLPVYTLFIGAFIPNRTLDLTLAGWGIHVPWLRGLVMFSMYMIGIVTGILVAWILKKTLLRGATPPFVMELPSYKLPGLRIVWQRMSEQGWAFLQRAGTLILAISVLVWGLGYFPHNSAKIEPALIEEQSKLGSQLETFSPAELEKNEEALKLQSQLAVVENQIAGEYLSNSYLGRMGHFIEPAVRPLGWDWKIGCAAIASFPAREVVNATLGVIYNLGEGAEEQQLEETIQAEKNLNVPVALSIMVFFALCAQCVSTLVIIRRETGTWLWPLFTFVYMTVLAYIGAFATYQIGMLFVASA
ncbi:MAG: ferrous iron transport protein B [Planctomycetales bacterium]|nr:ferrous iron transport protein B [Planctomycetales bacterium]